jgi:hypothetical protein
LVRDSADNLRRPARWQAGTEVGSGRLRKQEQPNGQEHPFRARERLGEIWPLRREAF